MHIAEGLLDTTVIIPLWIITVIYAGFCVYRSRNTLKEEQLPVVAVITAMVFAFQMLNFPIMAGTSGHLLGFVLMAILVSPSSALLMISVVLSVQAFTFGDGGIIALGANIFNMGIATLPGYFVYFILRKTSSSKNGKDLEDGKIDKAFLISAFVGAYVSLITSSLICGIQIGISESFPYGVELSVTTMLFYHSIIGIGEALITMFTLLFFNKYAPEYIPPIKTLKIWS